MDIIIWIGATSQSPSSGPCVRVSTCSAPAVAAHLGLLRVWHPPHPRLSVHDAARAAPRSAGSRCSSSAPAAPAVRSVTRLAAARRHPASAAHHLQQRPRVATRLLCAAAAPPAARFWPGSCWPGSSERPGSSEGKPGCEAQNRASRTSEGADFAGILGGTGVGGDPLREPHGRGSPEGRRGSPEGIQPRSACALDKGD